MYCKCGELIPKKREELGFTTCTNCSTTPKVSGHLVVHHKTGNEYEIIKDPEVAANISRMASRNGFGSNRKAMPKVGTDSIKKVAPSTEPLEPVILKKVPADKSRWKDEEWTLAILDILERSKEEANNKLEEVFNKGEISPIARKRLIWILNN